MPERALSSQSSSTGRYSKSPLWYATVFLRVALGAGYLSAVADRLGYWGPPGTNAVAWGNFAAFSAYTAKLNPWCPAGLIPALSWTATGFETAVGVALLVGLRVRATAFLSGLMALTFALAMSTVLGVHSALNFSVFVDAASSFVLAVVSTGMHVRSSAGTSPG